jgi:hypothetical protein
VGLLPPIACYTRPLACTSPHGQATPELIFTSLGDWIRLLRGAGFEIEDLTEIRPDARAT